MAPPGDPLSHAVTVLGDAAPVRADDGEPVFAEPWEGRAFAIALDVVERAGGTWEDFRARLVAAIAEDRRRPYYESWVVALEHLVLDTAAIAESDLQRTRNGAAAYRYDEEGGGDVEVFPIRTDPAVVGALLSETFGGPWAADLRPSPTARPGDVATRCRHAELYRRWSEGVPRSWGLRLFGGDDGPLLDVVLPNPLLDDDGTPLAAPHWSRLACWDHLRRRFLDLGPDPADRLAEVPAIRGHPWP